ncbi:HNH endonuclease [Flavicella sediminum]|uniref:HNH endonuclease n=1 Tax=Flavicella sediminum TaxID=2585141 RepID=UPI0011247781|nr:HNH endonuclease [Flavicella sediminum]
MIRSVRGEVWKDLELVDNITTTKKYRISNMGRFSYELDGKQVLAGKPLTNGYETLSLKNKDTMKKATRYVHKLVAQNFLEQGDGVFVIHLNYDKLDNRVENLKWATKREKEKHQFANPIYIDRVYVKGSAKLTEGRVRMIKKKVLDPNRKTRMKMIAKQFGISEMQLYRIKTGENWGEVTID